MAEKKQKVIPFDFVLAALDRLSPVTKPMFGCYAIYVGEKMVAVLRRKEKKDPSNGVWIASSPEHHASLKKDLPSLRPLTIFGKPSAGWRILKETNDDFEENVLKACELILKGDPRIGKITASRKKKKDKLS
jgi:hypothetical protein